MTGNEHDVGFLATGSGVKQFQLSSRGWFVRGARSSLAPGACALSDSGSGPFGSSEISAPKQTCPPWPRAAASSSTPPTANIAFTDPANGGMRRKFDLPPDRPQMSKRKTAIKPLQPTSYTK